MRNADCQKANSPMSCALGFSVTVSHPSGLQTLTNKKIKPPLRKKIGWGKYKY